MFVNFWIYIFLQYKIRKKKNNFKQISYTYTNYLIRVELLEEQIIKEKGNQQQDFT